MKNYCLIFLLQLVSHLLYSQEPPQGPYYFVTAKFNNLPQLYGENKLTSGGFNENMNILALLLGDKPEDLLKTGQTLVPKVKCFIGRDSFYYQPFAYRGPNGVMKNLPIGNNLKKFLDNYFGNQEGLDLTLPFYTGNTLPGTNGFAWMRRGDEGSYHAGIDFMTIDQNLYAVNPAADGVISEVFYDQNIVTVMHSRYGKQFKTGYYHLDSVAVSKLTDTQLVKRGQAFCKIGDWKNSTNEHLHFAVGLKGPSGVIDGVAIPELFYAIDPFGVYDYRRNHNNLNLYNYLPAFTSDPGKYLEYTIRGAVRKVQWKTNPLIHSLMKVLDTGDEHTISVKANKLNNYSILFVSPGQRYSLNAYNDDRWKNAPWAPEASAEGVDPGPFDGCRRKTAYKMMKLVGDVYRSKSKDDSKGVAFKIGIEKQYFTIPAGIRGFFTFYANDCPDNYGDNSGAIRVVIKRVE